MYLEIKSLISVPNEFAFHINEAGLFEKQQTLKDEELVFSGQAGVFTLKINLPDTFHPRKSAP
jgi:hypothetical protein